MPAQISLPYKTQSKHVPYGEMDGYSESYTYENGPESRRILCCNWSDVDDFLVAMTGDVSHGNGNALNRITPEPHPKSEFGYCVSCSLQRGIGAPVKEGNQRALLKYADLVNDLEGLAVYECTYRPLPYTVINNDGLQEPVKGGAAAEGAEFRRYVIKEFEFGSETYCLPGTSFVWEQPLRTKANGELTTTVISEPIPYQRPLCTIRYTWVMVPEPIPQGNIFKVVGKVNRGGFDGIGPGFLLCNPPEISERKHTASGRAVRDITYVLSLRPDSGWSAFYCASLGKFVAIRKRVMPPTSPAQAIPNEAGLAPYELANFDLLFTPRDIADPD